MGININSIKSLLGYTKKSINKQNSEEFSIDGSKIKKNTIEKEELKYKELRRDSVNISDRARDYLKPNGVGFSLDKGTAANTTMYVDKATFNNIVSYTTNNPDCQWEELGIDGEKRWVVVNGQRFECELTKEEKEAAKRAKKTLIDFIMEAEEKNDKIRKKEKETKRKENTFKLDFRENKIELNGNENIGQSEKVRNLMKNHKVMQMLAEVSRLNGGQISLSTV
ncbi:hypothetical protein [Hathewaya limosa]|uniref:Uncharacterized protein n=1 Tax=Hathewaya limosa TaxID=1536 RepID=A0ABU0JN21_HATLI|nr:hypothetical protein [Hathewaya limosa]MDQ0478455.1 hypothetical protein [Hathewaya limosa]